MRNDYIELIEKLASSNDSFIDATWEDVASKAQKSHPLKENIKNNFKRTKFTDMNGKTHGAGHVSDILHRVKDASFNNKHILRSNKATALTGAGVAAAAAIGKKYYDSISSDDEATQDLLRMTNKSKFQPGTSWNVLALSPQDKIELTRATNGVILKSRITNPVYQKALEEGQAKSYKNKTKDAKRKLAIRKVLGNAAALSGVGAGLGLLAVPTNKRKLMGLAGVSAGAAGVLGGAALESQGKKNYLETLSPEEKSSLRDAISSASLNQAHYFRKI